VSRGTVARQELSSLSRERTIVLALFIQLVIAGFSSFLVVGLTLLYDPGAVDRETTTVGIPGGVSDRLVAAAEESEDVDPERFESAGDALSAFEDGVVDTVVIGTRVATERGTRIQVDALAPADDLQTTLVVVSLRSYLSDVETIERAARSNRLEFSPLAVPEEESGSSFFGFTYTILLPLLLFLPPFLSGSIAVDSVTEERERGTLELLRVAPVTLVKIIDRRAAVMLLLAPLQAVLWIGLLQFNGFGVSNVPALVAFVAVITAVTVAIGVGLALVTGTRRHAQLLYSVLVLALLGVAVVAPEHPATTAALLAADRPPGVTFAHVAVTAVLGVGLYTMPAVGQGARHIGVVTRAPRASTTRERLNNGWHLRRGE
jgi:ABC-type Na+ efflux pump permease subunit